MDITKHEYYNNFINIQLTLRILVTAASKHWGQLAGPSPARTAFWVRQPESWKLPSW
jgi:hypothetical protein